MIVFKNDGTQKCCICGEAKEFLMYYVEKPEEIFCADCIKEAFNNVDQA